MRRKGTYLNTILTVNAVLLSGLLWTQIASTPILDRTAVAQKKINAPLNSAAQRMQIVAAIRETKASVDKMATILESGRLKVRVDNINELRVATDDRR